MSSTQQGSRDIGRARDMKADKCEKATRRSWSPKEEMVLLAALKELVANGWKSDNGFRGGYLTRLEDALAKEFPGRNIKCSPHITSKLQNWKKNYYSLTLMLSRSGIGFNADGNHHIECTDEQWDQITKCDPNITVSMRHKSWPMFEHWAEIFGKDRATGDNAEDVIDMVNNSMPEDSQPQVEKYADDYEKFMEDVSTNNDMGESSNATNGKEKVVNKKVDKGKKRRVSESVSPAVIEVLRDINHDHNARLQTIVTRIGYEFDLDQAKKEAFGQLTRENKFDLYEILADNKERLLIFQGLSHDDRIHYAHRLLRSKK